MKTLLSILNLCLLLVSCHKSKDNGPAANAFNCDYFKTGISTNDQDMVGTEVNKLCENLLPLASTPSDEYGQHQNINILVQRLSEKCDISATLVCYACIETLPEQSEIKIDFTQNGVIHTQILDISFTAQHMLVFNGMHD